MYFVQLYYFPLKIRQYNKTKKHIKRILHNLHVKTIIKWCKKNNNKITKQLNGDVTNWRVQVRSIKKLYVFVFIFF